MARPKATKVRRSKLPGYSISSSATANLRVGTAVLAVRGFAQRGVMEYWPAGAGIYGTPDALIRTPLLSERSARQARKGT
jgi:hypothetical protein